MKSYSWILILVLFLSGFSSCHSDAERYKDILREGSWYVYDIDYSYKLYDDFETPELFDFFHYLLDERNLLFLPGDELMFSKRRIDVNCPDGDRFGYDYYYSGDYIRIGRDGDYMDLFPQGDMNDLTLTLDRIGLENLLSYWAPVDEYYAYLLEAAYRNLYDFHITYHLQRPIPEMAQVIPFGNLVRPRRLCHAQRCEDEGGAHARPLQLLDGRERGDGLPETHAGPHRRTVVQLDVVDDELLIGTRGEFHQNLTSSDKSIINPRATRQSPMLAITIRPRPDRPRLPSRPRRSDSRTLRDERVPVPAAVELSSRAPSPR